MLALSFLGLVGTLGFLVVLTMFVRSLVMVGDIWELSESDDSPWMVPDTEVAENLNKLLHKPEQVDYATQDVLANSSLQDILVAPSLQDSLAATPVTTPSVS
ncbi:MAG TPA: hypothetical protein V6D07_14625 [Trichocoleus sp.]